MESDIQGIDAYVNNKNKLEDKYTKVISTLTDDEICDKNGIFYLLNSKSW